MTSLGPDEHAEEIRELLELLFDADIAFFVNQVIPRRFPGQRVRVTWPPRPESHLPWSSSRTTAADYQAWIDGGAYSAILKDGAILQFSFDFEGGALTGSRLAYIPCPFDVSGLLESETLGEVIEMFRAGTVDEVELLSPIRFDFDPASAKPGHPVSHMTLLRPSARIAAAGPVSLGHFIRFVFRHFYPRLWGAHRFLREWEQLGDIRTISTDEERELHLNWLQGV